MHVAEQPLDVTLIESVDYTVANGTEFIVHGILGRRLLGLGCK
jgi:hypothetical protein